MSAPPAIPPQPAKNPQALAIASFLRHNGDLKMRQGILNGKRADFFRAKRALRALQSQSYKKAQQKSSSKLPPIENEQDAIVAFRLLPVNQLAIRIEKLTRKTIEAKKMSDPNTPVPPLAALSKTKGVPTIAFVRDQVVSADDDIYYVWLWEKVPLTTYVYAGLIFIAIFGVILFPLWPPILRLGVWYISIGLLGLLALFFVMSIFRLILFGVTYFAVPPGLWLFPNLFEDVGFVDSFIPLYGWDVKPEKRKKKVAATVTVSKSEATDEDVDVSAEDSHEKTS
ncbi:translocation protein Sec62-domain-containing protein [Dipodascopsis uninucleata]